MLLQVGVQTCTATVEINVEVSQKTGNQPTSRSSYTTPGHIYKRCSILLQAHLINHVHYNFIHNSQKLEKAYISLNERTDKEIVVDLHNGAFLSC